MAYPEHWLLSFGGSLVPSEETWNCGIRLAITSVGLGGEMDEEQYLTDTAVPALTTWFGTSTAKIAATTTLTFVKCNKIAPDGTYADPSNSHTRTVNVAGGGGATGLHPLQVSYCLTWLTDEASRGPASRGRIYVPRPTLSVDAAGDVGSSDRIGAATAGANLLNSLDVTLGGPGGSTLRPCIVSPLGPGYAHQIDDVRVDSQLDIQRSRARSASRASSSQPVNY